MNATIAATASNLTPHPGRLLREARTPRSIGTTPACSWRIDASTRSFSSAGGATWVTESGKRSTTARSSLSRREHDSHVARCSRTAWRSSGVTAPSTYAPDSSSNSTWVIKDTPIHLLDLYYARRGQLDYLVQNIYAPLECKETFSGICRALLTLEVIPLSGWTQ